METNLDGWTGSPSIALRVCVREKLCVSDGGEGAEMIFSLRLWTPKYQSHTL